jgi:hypothetical protein
MNIVRHEEVEVSGSTMMPMHSLTNLREFVSPKICRGGRLNHKRRHVSCNVASLLTTPHSGYHYDDTGRRFFEGWYFKVSVSPYLCMPLR